MVKGTPKRSRRLVIDASVAGAAGTIGSAAETGAACREFLMTVLTVCHRAVFTPELREEWNEHQSAFARTWRRQMVSRKKVVAPRSGEDDALRAAIARPHPVGQPSRMLKDCHLVEAALATDRTVVSCDERARADFAGLARAYAPLRGIVWVNPARSEECGRDWLEQGARTERTRQLRAKCAPRG